LSIICTFAHKDSNLCAGIEIIEVVVPDLEVVIDPVKFTNPMDVVPIPAVDELNLLRINLIS
jgi:hypothetical protein